eukprot:755723-Hanusia_phi.AAC.2
MGGTGCSVLSLANEEPAQNNGVVTLGGRGKHSGGEVGMTEHSAPALSHYLFNRFLSCRWSEQSKRLRDGCCDGRRCAHVTDEQTLKPLVHAGRKIPYLAPCCGRKSRLSPLAQLTPSCRPPAPLVQRVTSQNLTSVDIAIGDQGVMLDAVLQEVPPHRIRCQALEVAYDDHQALCPRYRHVEPD